MSERPKLKITTEEGLTKVTLDGKPIPYIIRADLGLTPEGTEIILHMFAGAGSPELELQQEIDLAKASLVVKTESETG